MGGASSRMPRSTTLPGRSAFKPLSWRSTSGQGARSSSTGARFVGRWAFGSAACPMRTSWLTPGLPPRGEELVAPPTQQQGLGAPRLVEQDLADLFAALDLADPAADPETLIAGRVLDDSVERDFLAHHDLSHFGSPSLAYRTADVDTATWGKWAPTNRPVRPTDEGRGPGSTSPTTTLTRAGHRSVTSPLLVGVPGRASARRC